jgi:hypothetical protein
VLVDPAATRELHQVPGHQTGAVDKATTRPILVTAATAMARSAWRVANCPPRAV